ncbi:glycosyltransferase [bacterium]|nr:glycosyltransferase [bacterium]
MNTVIIIFYIIAGLYLIAAVVIGLAVRIRKYPLSGSMKVSLVMAARNEEQDLPRCLKSIQWLDYPVDKLQVILVDHASKDNTLKLFENFKTTCRFNTVIVSMKEEDLKGHGKVEALRAGVAEADGEVLIFADAECRFEPGWLQRMTGAVESGCNMAGGVVFIEGDYIGARLQKWDWLYLCTVGAGFIGLNLPQSLFGKNLAVRRDIFEKAGGFPDGHSWTEDLDLVRRCKKYGKVDFILEPSAAVISVPAKTIGEFFRQRIRWMKGGMQVGAAGLAAMILAQMMNLAVVISLFTSVWWFAGLFIIKVLADTIILHKTMKIYNLWEVWGFITLYQLFAIVYQILLAVITPLTRSLKWR